MNTLHNLNLTRLIYIEAFKQLNDKRNKNIWTFVHNKI